jgi:hypothetical protein
MHYRIPEDNQSLPGFSRQMEILKSVNLHLPLSCFPAAPMRFLKFTDKGAEPVGPTRLLP